MKVVNKIIFNNFSISGKNELNLCLDRSSVIQTFSLEGYLNIDYIEAGDIIRDRRNEKQVRGLLTHRETIEDYDDIGNVKRAFNSWLKNYTTHPMIAECKRTEGNEKVYFRLKNRFTNPGRNIGRLSKALDNYEGPGVFLTLTYEHKIDIREAWERVAPDWNRFLTRLKKEITKLEKEGEIKEHHELHYIWVLEAQGNGYPHIHALFLGIDYLYKVGNKEEWQNDNPHSKNIKHFWKRGSVFINRTSTGKNIDKPVRYMMKYIRKTFTADNDKAELTQSMLWAFNKRSWNTSRGLMQYLQAKPRIESGLILQGIYVFEQLHGQKTIIIWIVQKPKYEEIVEYNDDEAIKNLNREYEVVKNDYG